MRIVAIGGGEFKTRGTMPIDIEIKRMTGLERPRVLFIPTASEESGGYITTFRHVYGKELGCRTEPLMLLKGERKTKEKIRDKIMGSDVIYVGSGNTRFMYEVWKDFGVDEALREAADAGKLLCGLSAGAVCWFGSSWSDYPLLENTGTYTRLPLMGLLPGWVCPHADEEGRTDGLKEALAETGGSCLLLPNHGAVAIEDGRYRILRSRPEAQVLRMLSDGSTETVPDAGSTELLFPEDCR